MNTDMLFTFLATNLLWQTALIGAAVYGALKFLPRAHATTRYRIALGGLLGCVLLLVAPFLPSISPDLSVGVTAETVTPLQAHPLKEAPIYSDGFSSTDDADIIVSTMLSANSSIFKRIPVPSLLTILWAVGSATFLLRIMLAIWHGRTWMQQAQLVCVSQKYSLSRNVKVFRSPHATAPLVLGFLRPVILVPTDFNMDVSRPDIRVVLEHEIAHITRRDTWTNLAQKIVLALLWWCLPLHWVNAQIGIEREKLCDDMAAQKTGKGKDLARALLDLAESHILTSPPLLAIGIQPRKSQLAERVLRLYKGTPMTKLSKKLLLTTSLAVPLTLASLAIITPRAMAHNPQSGEMSYAEDAHGRITREQFALYEAVQNEDTVKALHLTAKTSPNFGWDGEGTPLIEAVRNNDMDMVKLLAKAGADLNLIQEGDGSPLISASAHGYDDIARYLLNHGAKVNAAAAGDGNPLIAAAARNQLSTVKLLLAYDADINAIVRDDETPLINASQQGHVRMAKLLVDNGANVSLGAWAYHYTQKDGSKALVKEWRTPFGEATKHGHTKLVQYLASQGASEKDGTPPKTTYNPMPSHKMVEGRVSSRFGVVRKNLGYENRHTGIDIVNKTGTPIYAPADGIVREASAPYSKGPKYGTVVVLETEGDVLTLFAHLQNFTVRAGDVVKAGDLIAHVGNTGQSTGPHVHIQTKVNGELMNPANVWASLKD